MKNIYQTINAVMEDVGAIGKNSKNRQQNFWFRGIDAVMNALNPAMIKHKLFVAPEVLEQTREERTTAKGGLLIYSICKIRYTFYAEDGSSVAAVVIGEGMDSGDKATNKAMSIAFKYACFQIFCIPTEEMKKDDPDNESPEAAPRKNGSATGKTEQQPVQKPKDAPISKNTQESLLQEIQRTGYDINRLFDYYNVQALDMLTEKQGASAIAQLSVRPTKAAHSEHRNTGPAKSAAEHKNEGFA